MSNMTWAVSCNNETKKTLMFIRGHYKKNLTHPQPIEVMNDGDVHHSAEYTTDIRPVHGIII